ncbi:MAG: sugar ABC transporter permease [Candidatus Velthaea sp.]
MLLAPAMILLLGLTLYPLIYSIYISFTDFHLGSPEPTHFVGFGNYVRMASDALFLGSLWVSAKFLIVAIPLQLLLGYLCASVFRAAQGAPFSRLLRTIFILPTMITPLCIGLFWNYILDPLTGVMNWVLSTLHLPALQWLSSTETALPTLIAIYLWEWTPFTTVLFIAGLLSISPSIYEAAKLDGANWFNMALRIDIPLLGSVISVAAILAVVEVIRLFDIIFGTTQGGPGSATLTNAVAIYRIGFQNFDTGYAAAASLVILIITIVVAQNLARKLVEENA